MDESRINCTSDLVIRMLIKVIYILKSLKLAQLWTTISAYKYPISDSLQVNNST